MGCCNRRSEGTPAEEGDQRCCGGIKGKLCFCLPYFDPFLISAQILSTIATLFSRDLQVFMGAPQLLLWITVILFQLPWCCRQHKAMIVLSVYAALVVATAAIGEGIYFVLLVEQDCGSNCDVWELLQRYEIDDFERYEFDTVWAGLALFCTALWLASAFLMGRFVSSGRHNRYEALYGAVADHNRGGGGDNLSVATPPPAVATTELVVAEPFLYA